MREADCKTLAASSSLISGSYAHSLVLYAFATLLGHWLYWQIQQQRSVPLCTLVKLQCLAKKLDFLSVYFIKWVHLAKGFEL